MKKHNVLFSLLIILCLGLVALAGGCTAAEASGVQVVTSTSLIAQIVERVAGDRVSVVNIIPPAQCPGHFDVKPGDIQKLADANLFLLHGWQGEIFSGGLIASANNPGLTVVPLNVKVGENMNWMAPPVQAAAVDRVTEALCEIDQKNADAYRQAAEDYKQIIAARGQEYKESIAALNPADINVLVAEQQAGFVAWAGFKIVATFGEEESMTPLIVKDLVDKGNAGNVTLVIDNLQSGENAGAGIAEELGSARAILSNFPGGFDNTGTWEKNIENNIELLKKALGK